MTVIIDGNLGITTPSLTATVITVDQLNPIDGLTLQTGVDPAITLLSGANLAPWTLTFPVDPGTPGQYLTTDGSGIASWTSLGISGTVSPGVMGQLTYYAATGDTVSGNANLTASGGALTLGVSGVEAGSLVLSGATAQTVTLNTAAAAGNWALTLPATTGASGEVLSTDGTGVTSWIALPGSVNSGTANQLAYYASTGDAVSGNANATITNGSLTLGVTSAVKGEILLSGDTSGVVTITPASTAGTWTLTLPDSDGNNGQALVTDGSGNTSWSNVGGSGTVDTGNTSELAYYSATGIVVSGNGNLRVSAGDLTLGIAGTTAGSIILSGATAGTVTISTAATAGNWTFTLPDNDGSTGQVLTTDGSGVSSWTTLPSPPAVALTVGSTAISGGTSGRVLYNDTGLVGELAVTGTGSAVLATSPTIATPAISTPAITKATITGLYETQTSIGTGAVTIDCEDGNVFSVTLSANITSISFAHVPASGTAYSFILSVTSGGSYTITWPGSVKWPSGVAPTITSTIGKVDTFVLYTFNGGTTWYAFVAGQNA